ncbi:MAG: glycoside hydrolase family 31 protein, partial [Melioribacter sp.]|nr:glycoside hydrolase family 31 protein [Melioribacter sp.]
MKVKFQYLFFFLLIFQIIYAFEKQKDGVLFELKKQKDTDAQLLKVQIITENIIRIIASPTNSFSTRKSLVVEKIDWKPIRWSVKDKNNFVDIITSKLIVRVNSENGKVAFYDNNEKLILNESANDSKIIIPSAVMGEQTYHIRQIFNASEDEAFYGLGAHQNGIMNYKGHDVDLWQYNIVDVIPFLVSSKNYGILWDNYSRTKFGDIREYQSLHNVFKLYDKKGNEGGLTAEYFEDVDFKNLFAIQIESKIEHEFLDVNDPFPEGFNEKVKAVRWSGEIESNESGIHKLRLYCSGYTKMWIDDSLIVDSWRQNWLPWTHLPKINMKPGEKHKIKIEWIHSGGYIGLKALCPSKEDFINSFSLYSEVGDQIDYYFIYGENLDDVIHGYRILTGKAPMMPKWAMGLWQCRERYKTQDELLSIVKEFRKRKIPLDNIVQDWFYWKEDQWGSHEFDKERFPDPEGMVKELHNKLHTRIMISVWPKFYVGTKHFEEFKKNGWLYMRNVEVGQKDWVGPGYVSTFYDPYSEGARKLYWKQINEKLFSLGFDAWWLDSTEPDLQSNLSFNEWLLRIGPTALGTSARYLNTYSLMNSKAVYEGQRKTKPNQRVFILTRSAFAGQQRYSAATWSGDVAARWFDLKNQISAGLNFSLSGIPYWTTDIGGFAVEPRYEKPNDSDLDEWRELNTRWFQFGTFCPLFRVH